MEKDTLTLFDMYRYDLILGTVRKAPFEGLTKRSTIGIPSKDPKG